MEHKALVRRLIKSTKKRINHKNKKLTSIKLDKKFANRYILYYGAKKRSDKKCNTKLDVNEAYNNNDGVSKVNSQGVANIYMNCPKSYKNNMSHLHYILSDKNNKHWLNKQYKHKIVCTVDKQFVKNAIKNKCYIIINALPVDYFIKDRIITSISLPYNSKASNSSITKYLLQVSKNYPKLNKFSNSKNIFNVPIIVYCYKSTCDASDKLIEKLMEIGFTNIVEYKEGILGWLKN